MEMNSANYFVLKNVGSGKCADVTGESKDKGTKLQQWSCNYIDNQKWNISDQGNGEYAILSKYSDMAMDVYRASKSNGASIIQWPWSGKDNQKWSFGTDVESDPTDTTTTDSSNSPIGFAADVTGGEGGSVVTVTTPAQLKDALSGNTPRIIRISGIIDFRSTEGTSTEKGCTYSENNCSYNGKQEKILNVGSYCSGRSLYDMTYDTAGKSPLQIGSNKTLVGVDSNSGIKGKGLRMSNGVSNIIVRNLSITDINDGLIWGGDAITITNASKIWIDHNYIARIGRQFIVTGYDTAQNVTISNNYLDGTSDYGHYCNQRHYWGLLLLAENQSITLASNRIHMLSGRSPKVGKESSASSAGIVHIVNNYYDKNYGDGFTSDDTAVVLMEGNYYAKDGYYVPITDDSINTPLFAPLDSSISSANASCQATLGRDCQANYDENASSNFVINSRAMTKIQQNTTWLNAVKSVMPKSYSSVSSQSFGPQSNISY
jgi:pectate lyase